MAKKGVVHQAKLIEKPILRPYQEKAVVALVDYINDPKDTKPSLIIVPTGGGKSLIIAEAAMRIGQPILSLQPSKELLTQNYKKLISFGGTATLYSASVGIKEVSTLTFATIQSIPKAVEELKALGVGIVLVDEAHRSVPPREDSMFMKFMEALQPKKVCGLTATPVFMKGGMQGAELKFLTRMKPRFFKKVICCVQIQELIRDKFWSPLKYEIHEFSEAYLKLNTNGSDFTEESIKAALKANNVNNLMLHRIKRLRVEGYKKILVFMDCVENAKLMAKYLTGAAVLTSDTKAKERELIIEQFASGEIDVLVNVNILAIGFDDPAIDAIVDGKPTNSLAAYYQKLGRGVRLFQGKKFCLIIDFVGNVKRFGRIEDLEIIDNPDHGWGIYNKNVLLTNVPMGGARITKEMLSKKALPKSGMIMPFGKHKGTPINQLPISYLEYQMQPDNPVNWNSNPIFAKAYKTIQMVLAEHKSNSLI